MGTRSFTDLEVYKMCRQLRIKVASLTERCFPEMEKYKLTDQIIRSSRRVTACIAEGYGRYYFKENIRFCRMARGSLLETLEHLITAFDSKYLNLKVSRIIKTMLTLVVASSMATSDTSKKTNLPKTKTNHQSTNPPITNPPITNHQSTNHRSPIHLPLSASPPNCSQVSSTSLAPTAYGAIS